MDIDMSKLYNPKILKKNEDTSEIDEILEQEEILYVISKNIILYRKENNLTQQQLAKKIKVNQTMISKLESGNYNPTFKQIYKITRKLTKTTDLFNKILEEIVDSLKKYKCMQYNIFISNEQEKDIEDMYISDENNKIIYLNTKKIGDVNNKGEDYEKYKSQVPVVG